MLKRIPHARNGKVCTSVIHQHSFLHDFFCSRWLLSPPRLSLRLSPGLCPWTSLGILIFQTRPSFCPQLLQMCSG